MEGNVEISCKEQLEAESEIFTNTITAAIHTATKKFPIVKAAPLPLSIRKLINEKKKARKRWQITRNGIRKQEYNNLKNKVHKAVLSNMMDSLDKDIEDANKSSNIWKITRRLSQPRGGQNAQPIQTPAGPVYSDNEKAEILADYFERQFFSATKDTILEPHYIQVQKEVDEFMRKTSQEITRYTTPSELKTVVKKLSCSAAPGNDLITNLAIRNLPKKAVTRMVKIFNSSMKLQFFPAIWKRAKIITIQKGRKRSQIPQNRRPISLLSVLGKLLERIILRRIQELKLYLIPDHQMAYRKGCSTTHQVLRLVEAITKGFNNNAYTPAIFFDVAKAFDSIWHVGLVYKLIHSELPDSIIKLIVSYLRNRQYQVREGLALSSIHPINAGVPQGSVLGPLLYNLYMADIPKMSETDIAQYADDTVIFITHINPLYAARSLQDHIDEIELWFRKWLISLNAAKTKTVCFTKCSLKRMPKLSLKGKILDYEPKVKYLGVTMDQRLTWSQHIKLTKGKAIGRTMQLFPLLKSSAINIRTKIHIYKALILPIMAYAAPAWAYVPPTVLKQLQVAQNKALRLIHGSDWYTRTIQIHDDLEVPYLEDYFKKIVDKFYSRLPNSPNQLVRSLGSYDISKFNKYRTPKMAIEKQL